MTVWRWVGIIGHLAAKLLGRSKPGTAAIVDAVADAADAAAATPADHPTPLPPTAPLHQ